MSIRLIASLFLAVAASMSLAVSHTQAADAKPTAVAAVKHDGPVNFEKEILPLLKKNCTACHNKAKPESDLNLENPAAILKGGSSGPAAVAGKGADSLLVARAAANDDEAMPPKDNKVGASHFTSNELGLLKLWIDQGATGTVTTTETIVWQPLPAGVNPIYAVVLTPDGQFAACSRANQIFVYHVPSGRMVGRLTDPALLKGGVYTKPGVADLDLVQSLAMSPDGKLLASGGFRTIKLWQRPQNVNAPAFGGAKLPGKPTVSIASPDGKQLALVIGNDVQLADVAANKLGAKLSGHKSPVAAAAFSADGKQVATVSADKTLRIWNAADGKALGTIELPAEGTAVAITADGLAIAVGANDGKLRTYDLPKEALAKDAETKPKQEWASSGKKVTAIAAVPNQPTQIVVGDEQGNVTLWSVTDVKKSVKAMQKTGGEVRALAVRADGTRIAAVDVGNALRLWNPADGKQVAEAKGDVRAARNVAAAERTVAVAKSQAAAEKTSLTDAEKSATTETDAAKKAEEAKATAEKASKEKNEALAKVEADKKKAEGEKTAAEAESKKADDAKIAAEKKVADAEAAEKKAKDAVDALKKDKNETKDADKALADASAKVKTEKTALQTATTAAAAASTKAKTAASAIDKFTKPLEDAAKAKMEADSVLTSTTRAIASSQAAAKRATAAVPAAKKRSEDAEALVKTKEAALEAAKKDATAAEKPFLSLAYSADGKMVCVGGEDKLVHTYDGETAAALDVLVGSAGSIVGTVFVGDDRIVSIAADGAASTWTLYPEWTWVRTIGDPASDVLVDRVTALDFSPDGKTLVSGGGAPSRSGELKIWNVADGKLVREVAEAHSDTVFGVRYSPDGTTLASCAADKFAKTFKVADGSFIRNFEGHTHHVLGVAWSADGRTLVTAGADNVVKIWDVGTGEQKKTVQGFTKEVTSIAFIGGGVEVVATSGDKTVRTLKSDNGQMGKTLSGSGDFVYTCAASLDGTVVVSGGQDGVLRVWDVAKGTELKNFAPPADTTNQQAQK